MGKQYVGNTLVLVASVVGIVWARVFTGGRLEWVEFGIAAGVAVGALLALAGAKIMRDKVEAGVLTVLAGWAVVASLTFSGTALGWLSFANSIALASVAVVALALNEVSTERVVHTLEVRDQATSRNSY